MPASRRPEDAMRGTSVAQNLAHGSCSVFETGLSVGSDELRESFSSLRFCLYCLPGKRKVISLISSTKKDFVFIKHLLCSQLLSRKKDKKTYERRGNLPSQNGLCGQKRAG